MEKKEFVIYDYRTVTVRRDMEAMTTDAYEALGWEAVGSSVSGVAIFHVNLSFKRDRKIKNKAELLKSQERIDSTLGNIETLQNKKKNAGTVPALVTGITGALVLGGGMSMVMELAINPTVVGWMVGGIVLGVVGLVVCGLAWWVNRRVRRNAIKKIAPMLEDEYNRLSDICENTRVV